MIQFSKELYGTGKYDVVYRKGERVKDLAFFKDGIILSQREDGRIYKHTVSGKVNFRFIDEPLDEDLFLIPKERWANRYTTVGGPLTYLGPEYDTQKEAVDNKNNYSGYIETVKIVSA